MNVKRSANIIQKNPFTVNEVQFKFNPDQSPDPNQNQKDKWDLVWIRFITSLQLLNMRK